MDSFCERIVWSVWLLWWILITRPLHRSLSLLVFRRRVKQIAQKNIEISCWPNHPFESGYKRLARVLNKNRTLQVCQDELPTCLPCASVMRLVEVSGLVGIRASLVITPGTFSFFIAFLRFVILWNWVRRCLLIVDMCVLDCGGEKILLKSKSTGSAIPAKK